ncbi:PLD nuclease N-terminal domain-containing protein [Demetria terragena]|uniref:PLD nuclease N-terminal domain-containing protein n=1 Tax=Demetria terragena TaxID=63959 RepID=UPI0003A02C60|nr:PLD nuclease N-terminal domain-containing protein [Demetria terragena]
MPRVIVPLLGLALTVYALVDCGQTGARRTRYLPKPAWLAVIVLLPFLGPAGWLLVGKVRQAPGPSRRSRPRGPDDDPDFLRGL